MFDIAFSELVVIGLIALVILGPKRLPEMARAAGRWTARTRRFIDDVKRDMGSELRREELAELRSVQQQLTETRQLIENTASSTFTGISGARSPDATPEYLVKALPADSVPTSTKKKELSRSTRKKKPKQKTRKARTRKAHV